MIDKVKKTFYWLKPGRYHGSEEDRQKHIRQVAENRQKCSCDICCNPRNNVWAKGERLTIQERRMEEYEIE